MKFKNFLCLGLCWGMPSWGMYLNDTKVLEISISKTGLTRLSVEGDSIQDMFVHPAELTNNVQLHKSGQVFLTPEGIEKPIFATIITTSGKTQDLKLVSTSKASGPVILRQKPVPPPPVSLILSTVSVDEVLAGFVKGQIPPGFRKVSETGAPRLVDGLVFEPKAAYSNGTYRVVRFEAKNESLEGLALSQEKASGPEDMALSFDRLRVESGAVVSLYVEKKKKNNERK